MGLVGAVIALATKAKAFFGSLIPLADNIPITVGGWTRNALVYFFLIAWAVVVSRRFSWKLRLPFYLVLLMTIVYSVTR